EAGYLVPTGFGISMCTEDYLVTHISKLKSRYLIVPCTADLYEQAVRAGWQEIYANGRLVILSR
ncbi:MAG: hypothetical protein ILP13_06035, partial [Lachnospiraceae bacterium]|nr:hypothetical protein [Lachnospiraceae bacterium]